MHKPPVNMLLLTTCYGLCSVSLFWKSGSRFTTSGLSPFWEFYTFLKGRGVTLLNSRLGGKCVFHPMIRNSFIIDAAYGVGGFMVNHILRQL